MLIEFISRTGKGSYKTSSIIITHENNEPVEFKVDSTFNSSLMKDDAFHYLNVYLSTLDPNSLNNLFNLYKQASEILMTPMSMNEQSEVLSNVMCSIVDGVDLSDIYRWFDTNREELGLKIPENCLDVYELKEEDNRGTREQTYLTDDYKWLISLSIALRTLLPIWAEYVDMIKLFTGGEFKEMKAFQLIYKSNIFKSQPFEKLKTYIRYNLKPENYILAHHVIKGINSGVFFEWLLSLMVLRRLCIKDLRSLEPGKNMITFVHQFINQKVDSNTQMGKQIQFIRKPDEKDGGNSSDSAKEKASRLEIYKQKQDVAQGEIVEIEHSISDFMRCAERLCFTIDKNLVMECIKTARTLRSHSLSEPQITLLKWVFKPIVSPRGIPYISKDKIIDALGVTQAVLWARGHKYLSLLSTCYTSITSDVMDVAMMDPKTKIPKELTEKINNELYPFSKTKKKDTITNMVLKSIGQLSDKFSSTPWTYTASEKFVKEVCPDAKNGVLPNVIDLKILLTKLVIEIGSRNFN